MKKTTLQLAGALLIALCSWNTHAEVAIPTALDFSEVERINGQWKVTLDMNGNEIDFYLTVVDIDGKVGATIDTERQSESSAIETITKTSDGVDFEFDYSMGEQSFTLHLVLQESAGTLSGMLSETNGLFKGSVTGVHGTLDESIAQRKSPTEAKLRIDGKKIRITFGGLEVGSEDHATLSSLSDKTTFTYVGSRATKLFTDVDLKFGETVVAAHNVAPNYPGVYSLWLKRNGNDWSLVFNEQPDIWGTQHDAAFDVATISLTTQTTKTSQEIFLVTLVEKDSGGQLKLTWGSTVWSAPFSTIQ